MLLAFVRLYDKFTRGIIRSMLHCFADMFRKELFGIPQANFSCHVLEATKWDAVDYTGLAPAKQLQITYSGCNCPLLDVKVVTWCGS